VGPELVGQRLGAYDVQAQIGAGGMGVVYRAIDTNLNRPVAIKVLSNALADPAGRRRFQREAQAVSSLNHPHIVTVHDAGQDRFCRPCRLVVFNRQTRWRPYPVRASWPITRSIRANPKLYAFTRLATQRNIYRVPVP
jgi:serine/threonine protein kinase